MNLDTDLSNIFSLLMSWGMLEMMCGLIFF